MMQQLSDQSVQYYLNLINLMNFLNFLTSGAGIFNFNLQNLSLNSNTLNRIPTHPNNKLTPNQTIEPIDELPSTLPQTEQIIQRIVTNSQAELLTHQQQLINQYMHLNIQLLSKKIESLETQPDKKEETSLSELKSNKKKIKKQNINCGHNDRQHYAKGMCNNCYHKNGRTKKPWKCEHEKLYANGLCQNCYINKYNKMKRQKNITDKFILQPFESKQLNSEPKIEQSS